MKSGGPSGRVGASVSSQPGKVQGYIFFPHRFSPLGSPSSPTSIFLTVKK